MIPTQLVSSGEGENPNVVMLVPAGDPGIRRFNLIVRESPVVASMKATPDPNSGQVVIEEKGERVLQYNYQTINEKDVVRLEGEMLTRDWPEGGHPHHRAIFWAWPEVEYGAERGDIYALQRVFTRPTGNIESLLSD